LYDTNWKQHARNIRADAFLLLRILLGHGSSFAVTNGHQYLEKKYYTVFIFNVEVMPEDGGSKFVQNVGVHLLDCSVITQRTTTLIGMKSGK
jgi:hypothetical protein